MKILYIGSIVPDESSYVNKAFSRAGNMFQLSLHNGFIKAGITPSAVLSFMPAVSFPKSRKIFFKSTSTILEKTIRLNFLPFININPIKQFSIGVAALFSVLFWAWRMRHSTHRIIYNYKITVPPGKFID